MSEPGCVSFSIEAEDLLIKRIFDSVFKGRIQRGVFLDLGASHPVRHSNTYFFYQLGWRGVNVEPNPEFIEEYRKYRPEDAFLNYGVSDQPGVLTYHRFGDPLVNGFYSIADVDRLKRAGYPYLGSMDVRCLGIRDLLQQISFEIDLLNIDVELHDARILRAWDWTVKRPKVICAEIHARTIRDVMNSEITGILEAAGYEAVSRSWQSAIFFDPKSVMQGQA
jgi:FkbM family methyltransferase